MKVVHICLVAYLDGWGYQDNLLPDYMVKAGHDVVVVSSANHFPSFLKNEEKEKIQAKGNEYYYNNVHIYRIKTKLNTSNFNFYCSGLSNILKKERPDVIFHHDVNCTTMLQCWWYCKKNPNTKLFVDNHADYINQSKRKLWNLLVPHGLLRLCVKLISKRVLKFYGVSPERCLYFEKVYGAPHSKVSLLPIGSDTDLSDALSNDKQSLRAKYGIPVDAKVIISGGKMGEEKGTKNLIDAVGNIHKDDNNVRLILFGSFTDEDTKLLAEKTDFVFIQGWCNREKTLELLKLSDIACWPIHHTTLIEDAIGCAIPIIIRETGNTSHLIEGNGEFVESGKQDELVIAVKKIFDDLNSYKSNALIKKEKLSYKTIVSQIESDCKQ